MAREAPLAYFLTFTTYGRWLHGDRRGSVDRKRNEPGGPGIEPSPSLVQYERDFRSKHPAVTFTTSEREAVRDALDETCRFRDWSLLALNVRTNHVHVVVAAEQAPERVLTALKANATRRLAERGMRLGGRHVWTRHGSTRYLWTEDAVAAACRYTLEAQDAASGRWDDPPDAYPG